MEKWIRFWFVPALFIALIGPWGCSASGESNMFTAAATTGSGGEGGEGVVLTTGSSANELTLEPATIDISVVDGVVTPVQFKALRGGEQVFPGKWWVDYGQLAAVDVEGKLTPTGKMGGVLKVYAEHDKAEASAIVKIRFEQRIDTAGIDDATKKLLEGATTVDVDTMWTYPYDGTTFPKGLAAPEMMWNGSTVGDVYFAHFKSDFLDYGIFFKATPPSRFMLATEGWLAVSESSMGGPTDIKVTRLVEKAKEATVIADHDWTIARGRLRGTVYYWANNLGRVVRIQPGATEPDDFLAAAGQNGCSACHTVSADGRTLVLGGDIATNTYDLVNDQPVLALGSVGKAVRNWAMPAVSPDGKYIVENNADLPGPPGGSDGVFDAVTGQKLPNTGLEGTMLDYPAFGVEGTKLVYVEHDKRDLFVYNFDMMTAVASSNTKLIDAGTEMDRDGIFFPNVSPTISSKQGDGIYTVYHRGKYPGSKDTRFGPGDLYMASATQAGVEWRLAAANGDGYPFAAGDRDRAFNYEPTFAPDTTGGYMWVVFTSRRTYGNRATGGSTQVKQLWMMAVDLQPEADKDPSHPAFWVSGQDPSTLNMRGYWALDPCVQQGNMCNEDGECCDGNPCIDGLCGGPQECAEIGELCNGASDCCDPTALCLDGICQPEAPK